MKNLLLFIAYLFTSLANANSDKYQIVSFYEEAGFVTERLIPFAIKDNLGFDVTNIQSILVEKPCYGMIDPHRSYIAHVYCTEEVDTHFVIRLRDSKNMPLELSSPIFHVKKVALVSSTPKPKDTTDPYALGRKLYTNNCASCHKSSPISKGVTRTILTNAFAGLKMRNGTSTIAMKPFDKDSSGKPFFTNAELDQLVRYINEEL
jgi:mono/diheme cytochrome c family protein